LARSDVPARVVMNEYVEIAHAFFSGKEPGMVNGVLDHVARSLREAELSGTGRDGGAQAR
jgi:N utilization substance protein B